MRLAGYGIMALVIPQTYSSLATRSAGGIVVWTVLAMVVIATDEARRAASPPAPAPAPARAPAGTTGQAPAGTTGQAPVKDSALTAANLPGAGSP